MLSILAVRRLLQAVAVSETAAMIRILAIFIVVFPFWGAKVVIIVENGKRKSRKKGRITIDAAFF